MKIGSKNWSRRWVIGAGGFLGEVTLRALDEQFWLFRSTEARMVELTDLFIHPQRRSKGWSHELLAVATAYADKQDLDLILRVCAHGKKRGLGNDKLIQLYEAHGFVRSLAFQKYMIRRAK